MKHLLSLLAVLFLCASAAAQDYGVVRISVCNLRRTPDYDAEMVSQALLGTPVHILRVAEKNGWPEVQTPDGYTGWVHKEGIQLLSREEYAEWNAAEKVVVTALAGIVTARPGPRGGTVSDVTGGDRLRLLGERGRCWAVGFPDGRTGWLDKRLGERESRWLQEVDRSADAILATALSMQGFPYLWAGMSPKGMDCSGFVRATLALHGILIPRDASQQAPVCDRIEVDPACSALRKGDLLFFGTPAAEGRPERVSHVGFYLGGREFIHSLGLVRVGSLDPESPLYDAYNAGRLLFAGRFLPYLDRREGISTFENHPYYNETE